MDQYQGKELQGLEEDPKAEIRLNSPKAIFKKVPNWKTPSHVGLRRF